MFDSFFGLPLHVFVLHATVILVPLSAPVTAAVFLRPQWRRFGAFAAAWNVALLVLTFVTVRAGYNLQKDLGGQVPTNDHEAYGETLLWIVLALAVTSVLACAAMRSQSPPAALVTGIGGVVALLAVASLVLTVVTGHSGSESHWGYLRGQ